VTIKEYFSKPDTPATHSPVGELMLQIVDKHPGIDFEEARSKANELIQKAAGKRYFRFPKALSAAEEAAQSASLSRFLVSRRTPKP